MPETSDTFDPWAVLGISIDATRKEARAAYRRLALQHHPDSNRGDPDARLRFEAVKRAWDFVGKERPLGSDRISPFAYAFEDLVRASEDFEAERTPGRPERGADVEAEILLAFPDTLSDCTRTVAGKGRQGRLRHTTVAIPAGVTDGEIVIYRKLGEPGYAGGSRGDLRLRVRIAAADGFQVVGLDVVRKVRVPVWDAALGCEIPVPMPRGGIRRLTLPPGSPLSVECRLVGHGVESAGRRGDYLVQVEVEVPDAAADPKLGRLFAAMRPGCLVAA